MTDQDQKPPFDIRTAAAAQFKEKRGSLTSLPVPEWGEDAQVYYYPHLTIAEWELFGPYLGENHIKATAICFCCAIRDKAGKRLYNPISALDFVRENLDFEVVADIITKIGYFKQDVEADAKKPLDVMISLESSPGDSST